MRGCDTTAVKRPPKSGPSFEAVVCMSPSEPNKVAKVVRAITEYVEATQTAAAVPQPQQGGRTPQGLTFGGGTPLKFARSPAMAVPLSRQRSGARGGGENVAPEQQGLERTSSSMSNLSALLARRAPSPLVPVHSQSLD